MVPLLNIRREVSPRHGGEPIAEEPRPVQANRIAPRAPLLTQSSLPQFRRQCAVDVPPPLGTSCAVPARATPTIVLSPNNSFESNVTSLAGAAAATAAAASASQQRLRQEAWGKASRQHSSVTSSVHSNGDIKSHILNRSRKNSLFDLRDNARRKFSLIPQVSNCKIS